MNNNGLDEMQIQRKNKIGNQAFLMLLYLLLLDTGLYGFGFRWIDYPANIMLILLICSGIYIIRLIAGNAYVGPTAKRNKPIFRSILTILIAIVVAIIMIIFKNANITDIVNISDISIPDNISSNILLITAIISIVMAAIIGIIKNIQNRNDRE
jgi:hypothetical protein